MAKTLQGCLAVFFCVALAQQEQKVKVISKYKPDDCDSLPKARKNIAAAVRLKGYIEDGLAAAVGVKFTEFNESQNMETVLGTDPHLVGLHEGMEGMCVGEKRTVIVPPELGHGDTHHKADFTTIPPNSTLRFEVELVALGKGVWHEDGKPVNIFKKMDTDGDDKVSEGEFTAWFQSHGGQTPPEGLFKQEDQDLDGFISHAEFTGPKGNEEL
jgi:hypothetical protein